MLHRLTQTQLEAAADLYKALNNWQLYDSIFLSLKSHFPGFDLAATLLKVTTVNQFYSTNLLAVTRMAEHISQVMLNPHPEPGVELVEKLAALPVIRPGEMARNHISFASKFAHFFIEAEKCPILDKYSEEALVYHLGRDRTKASAISRYRAYVENIIRLKEQNNLNCTNPELDRYLWLAGISLALRKNPNAFIEKEAKALFQNPAMQNTLEALLPG